jgi:hypothetical protein
MPMGDVPRLLIATLSLRLAGSVGDPIAAAPPAADDAAATNESAAADPCAERSDVPCMHIPVCGGGGSMATGTMMNDQHIPPAAPSQSTRIQLCHNRSGMWIHGNASDVDIFNSATDCNSDVFSTGDVMEVFLAPVQSVHDNPSWYYELDTAATTGALWASLSHNPLGRLGNYSGRLLGGNTSACRGGNCCTDNAVADLCGRKIYPGGQAQQHCNQSNLVSCNLACHGRAQFPKGPSTSVSQGPGWWSVSLYVPFSMYTAFLQPGERARADTEAPAELWRLNVYRYDYPSKFQNGSWDHHDMELSAWSPSGRGNFHMPQYFGIGVLDGLA